MCIRALRGPSPGRPPETASRGDLDSRGCTPPLSNLCDCWQREGTAWGAAPRKGAVRGGPDRPWTDPVQPRVLCARLAAAGARGCRRPQERPGCLLARGIGCSGPSGGLSARSPRSPAPCLPGARPRTWVCLPVVRGLLGALGLPAVLSAWIPRAASPGPPCGSAPPTRAPCACRCPSVQGRPGGGRALPPAASRSTLHSLNLLFPRPACPSGPHPPRASGPRAPPRALQARPSGDRRALRRTGAPRRVVSPGGGRSATGHGAGARGRAGREAGCALRGGQRRAPGRGGAALPGRATAGLAARGGRSSRTGPPCSGPGASRVKLTCLTTV